MCFFVFAEITNDQIPETTLEVVSEARRLALRLKQSLCCIVLGARVGDLIDELACYGPDTIIIAEDSSLAQYAPETWTCLLSGLCREFDPSVFIFSATALGDDLARRVAAQLRTGLIPDVDKFQISKEGTLLMTRLCFERKVHATVMCPQARPQMATVERGVMKIQKMEGNRALEIIRVNTQQYLSSSEDRVKITGFIKADPGTIDIADAEVIVSGGMGAGDKKGFGLIRELAGVLNASLAGSRVAMDKGFINRDRQIGQSGKTVAPDLIISCGISGANAHVTGMRDSKTIIAVNTDKNATMIKMADLGVVGDLHEILPLLIDKLKEHYKQQKSLEQR